MGGCLPIFHSALHECTSLSKKRVVNKLKGLDLLLSILISHRYKYLCKYSKSLKSSHYDANFEATKLQSWNHGHNCHNTIITNISAIIPAQSLLQKHSSKKAATDVISVYKQMTTALGEYLATSCDGCL